MGKSAFNLQGHSVSKERSEFYLTEMDRNSTMGLKMSRLREKKVLVSSFIMKYSTWRCPTSCGDEEIVALNYPWDRASSIHQ